MNILQLSGLIFVFRIERKILAMKTIFTIILLFISIVGTYSQVKPSASKRDGAFVSGVITENQSFFIKKIFPNPVTDIVTVDVQTVNSGNVVVNLYNILGIEVRKFDPIFLSQGEQQFQLDLSMFKQGIYILKVNMSGQVFSQVVKKN